MNLNTITEVRRVTGNGDEDFDWREGDSWLAGGTWPPNRSRICAGCWTCKDSPGAEPLVPWAN